MLAAIGVLVQTMITTGLGFKLGRLMLDISGGNLFVGLVLGMLLSLLIGMGLPTPAAYTVIAIVVIPVLIDLGVTDLAAHFFGFYFGIFSSISPPVAVGVLTAVRISGAGFFDTAWECIRLGSLGFLLPFLFVAYPSTLDVTALTVPALSAAALLMLATFMAGCAFYGELLGRLATFMAGCAFYGELLGRLAAWERALLTLGPVAFIMFLFMPSVWIPLFAVALLVGVIARRRYTPSSPGAAARHSKSRC